MDEKQIKDLMTEVYDFAVIGQKVTALTKRFEEHAVSDKDFFDSIWTEIRKIPEHLEKLEKELKKDMEGKYVSTTDFKVFQTEITNSVDNACQKINNSTESIKNWIKWTIIGFIGGWAALAAILLYIK